MAKHYTSRGGKLIYSSRLEMHRWNDVAYGAWRCKNGREVLFNRFYEPILERQSPQQSAVDACATEWVKDIVSQAWFYTENRKSTEKSLIRIGEAAIEAFRTNQVLVFDKQIARFCAPQ
jgi:hypothetical protein